MNCCSSKRKQWLNEVISSPQQETIDSYAVSEVGDKPPRMFEYIGNNFLVIIGVASGKPYHFKCKGDKVKVDYTDSFSMMAERDLVLAGS